MARSKLRANAYAVSHLKVGRTRLGTSHPPRFGAIAPLASAVHSVNVDSIAASSSTGLGRSSTTSTIASHFQEPSHHSVLARSVQEVHARLSRFRWHHPPPHRRQWRTTAQEGKGCIIIHAGGSRSTSSGGVATQGGFEAQRVFASSSRCCCTGAITTSAPALGSRVAAICFSYIPLFPSIIIATPEKLPLRNPVRRNRLLSTQLVAPLVVDHVCGRRRPSRQAAS